MSFTFNPFTGNLDVVTTITATSVGSSPNANGLSISGGRVITLQPADGTNPGVLTAGTQTIGGNKTFNGTISASNLSGTNSGDVTLTTAGSSPNANGASLSGQVLTLQPANTSFPGILLAADWNTFNNKQPAGNYITALTGDATASGPGSAALTLATVNSNVGSFTNASITVNAKGLITAASNGTTAVTSVSVVSANGFAGSSSGGATPALTLTTTITGLLKGNGTAISAASAGTDYVVPFTGDIVPTSFSAANNQSAATNVTGLAFANGTTRSFTALVSITVIATSSLYEYVTLEGIQRGSDWQMNARSAGDISGFLFTITTAGQIQYTNSNYSGFSSATLKFRALTSSI